MGLPQILLTISCLYLGLGSGQYTPDLITSLPGLSTQLNFLQWSGFLQAGEGKYFHYWFVESQGNPASDPLVLWLNGGPGCSSLEGLLAENGPYRMNADGSLYINQYSWNQVANVLYLESPAGVGYSYSLSRNYEIDDQQVAADNYQALLSFFEKFPTFANHDFYIFGESYGGVYIPSLSAQVVNGTLSINFKGFGVGNGLSSYELNDDTLVEFGYYHGLFGDNLWASLKTYCCSEGTCNFYDNLGDNCYNAVSEAYDMIEDTGLNIYNLYSPCWGAQGYQGRYAADMSNLFRKYQFNVATPPSDGPIPGVPECINATAMYVWLNRNDVKKALHIPDSLPPTWACFASSPCSPQVSSLYQRQYTDMAPFYLELLKHDLRALVYNGDTDMACNFLGGEKFVEALKQPLVSSYQPWYLNKQVAGFFKEYEKITFLTVKGSGHMVPQYRPAQALKMFESFLKNTSFL
ncbi:lysosomal protective protein-like [Loxodonta africana]|uniref:lysosomal protective protein-like n=1 Tax=Loxodonta africana TaxID=9785 RepID=UPI000C812B14|nr:lysosomal protective protein-like [Loxodonta africana]